MYKITTAGVFAVTFFALAIAPLWPAKSIGAQDEPFQLVDSTTPSADSSFDKVKEKAEAGDAKAQIDLGLMYVNGQGIAQNYKEALKWFRRAAEQGDAFAQGALGAMYYLGQGVAQNYKEAAKWLRRAAEQGSATAQSALGAMYVNGRGVAQNYKKAAKWRRRAAEQGNASAQSALGAMYYFGRGVAQNYKEAYIWFSIAAANGMEEAEQLRNDAAKLLSASSLEAAQAEATRRLKEIREKQAENEN